MFLLDSLLIGGFGSFYIILSLQQPPETDHRPRSDLSVGTGDASLVGQQLSHYQIAERIGSGLVLEHGDTRITRMAEFCGVTHSMNSRISGTSSAASASRGSGERPRR